MDYYYTSAPNVSSSRGRFSSRGGSSYRGVGRGESSYRGSRGGGYSSSPRGYSNSRGRGSYYPKYDNTGSKYTSDATRYGSQTRAEDSYRKPDSSPYGSSRDHSHHRSDMNMSRKRLSDSYSQSQGTPGGRRSHEMEDYRGGGSRYSNSNSYTDSRSLSDSRGIFKKPRLSDYKPKQDYRSRKDIPRSSLAISKLRSFRGRSIRGRAVLRRGGDSFLARKRAAFSGSRTSELIALRRAKLLRSRRLRERARLRIAEEKAEEEEKKEGEENENEEKKDEENQENGEQNTEEKESKEKEKDKEEEGEICDGENENKEKEKPKNSEERFDFFRKPFMKLVCPQCSTKCITFKEYIQHLYQPTHVKAMKEKNDQVRQTLVKMRLAQRAKQKEVDEEDLTNMNTRSIFCPICKLNHSQEKSIHQSSEAHKKLKNFLHPYCGICRISYKNPMIYERHICSLEHMRKKNALDQRLGKTKGSGLAYLDNFMVLDSVGSGDEPDEKDEKGEDEAKKKEAEKKSDDDLNLGIEFIRKVEAFYCELCRTYLPRITNEDRVLKVHCRTKYHLRCYSRFGSNEFLAQVESRKKKVEAEKEEKVEVKEERGELKGKEEGKENANHEEGGEDEVGLDDKLWADVSDLLNQVEPETKSDDEEEEEGGRFDRFKSNEKKENGEVGSSEEGVEEKEKIDNTLEELKLEAKEEA